MADNILKHSTLNTEQPLNVFLNNRSTFDVYNDKINLDLSGGGVIETCNFLVKYDTVGYEWTSNALPYVFDQNEFSNIGNNVFFKSLPYSKFEEKGSTSISDVVNIVEPTVTTGGPIQSSNIAGNEFKYLSFTVKPNLVYDFTSYNTLETWKAYADSLEMTYELNTGFASSIDGVWLYTDAVLTNGGDAGFIQFQLPTGYDTVEIVWGKGYASDGTVKLYINDIVLDSIGGTTVASKTFTTNTSQYYVAGQYVKIEEDFTILDANIKITFSLTQTSYTINFPTEGTECSALILGNPNYTYIPSLTLFGDYNISVGNTSSISKSDSTFTQNNSQTAQTLPFSNSITGSSVTYTSPRVIIKYKLTKGSSYTGKSQGILKYLPTPSTPQPSNTGTWTIEESANTTFKSDFLYILNKSSNPILANNIYTTEFLFDPDTKFNDKANINKNYKYNICLSVISTHPTDKLKYCVAFVYYNNKNGPENFYKTIISSNNQNDWTIDNYTHPTTQKRYVKITVKTINLIESLNVKI
jgi:hypothetical protein